MTSIPKPHEKRFFQRWWFWVLMIVALCIIAGVVAGFVMSSKAKYTQYDYLKESVTVEKRTLKRVVNTNGTIKADESTQLAFAVPGRVTEVNYSVGDEVNKDDVLIKIDADITARASDEEIKSPFDGKILAIHTFEGDKVALGAPVVEVGYRSTHIEFYASESEVLDLNEGQEAEFTVPSIENGKEEYKGEVTFVDVKKHEASAAMTGQATESGYLIKVSVGDLPDEYAKVIGLTVDLEIEVGKRESAPSLEIAAIQYDDDNKPYVFLVPTIDEQFVNSATGVEDITSMLSKKSVTTGFRGDEYVEITDGLRAGDAALMYIPQSSSNSLF